MTVKPGDITPDKPAMIGNAESQIQRTLTTSQSRGFSGGQIRNVFTVSMIAAYAVFARSTLFRVRSLSLTKFHELVMAMKRDSLAVQRICSHVVLDTRVW